MTILARSMIRSPILKSYPSRISSGMSSHGFNHKVTGLSTILQPSPSSTSISIPISISTRRLLATATESKPKAATKKRASSSSKSTTKSTSKTKSAAKPKKKAAVVKKKKAAPKPKKEKLKPWQARGPDGKLLPLPSATKPTRRTSFLLFMAEKLPAAKASGEYLKKSPKTGNDILDIGAAAKAIGGEWRDLSASEKQKYEELAEVEKSSYERALANWTAALSPEDIRRQNAYIAAQKKAGKRVLGRVSDANKPKKPMTAFFLFLSNYRKTADPSMKTTEQVKAASVEWKSLNEEEKDSYEKKAEGLSKQYRLELEEYKKSNSI